MGELIPRVFRAFQVKIPIGIRGEIPIGITFTGEIPIGFFRVSFLRGKSLGFFKGVKSEKVYKTFLLEVGRCPPSQPRAKKTPIAAGQEKSANPREICSKFFKTRTRLGAFPER